MNSIIIFDIRGIYMETASLVILKAQVQVKKKI